MEVRSWYAETEISLDQDWSFEFLGTIDAWSSDSMDSPRYSSSSPWLENVPEEIEKPALYKRTQHHDFSFEYGISDEPDYLSRSYAVEYSYKLALIL